MLVTVTGGAGRLGNVLVRALLQEKHTVRVLEPSERPMPSLAGLKVEMVHGSVLDPQVVQRAVEGAEVVYHVAAKINLSKDRDGSIFAVNVRGTQHVVDAVLATGKRLVHCSSHHALERVPLDKPLDEERPLALNDVCDYHRSKAQAEQLVIDAVKQRGLNAVIVNPATMIGPYDFEPSMIGRPLVALAKGELPAVIEAVSDYVDVRDVALGMIAAAQKGVRGERYLLSGEVVSMSALVDVWSEITGVRPPRIRLPLWVGWAFVPAAAVWSMVSGKDSPLTPGHLRAAISTKVVSQAKAKAALDYRPRSVRDSLLDTHRFFRDQGWLWPATRSRTSSDQPEA
jgi:dihydroflavonol-4-reductase